MSCWLELLVVRQVIHFMSDLLLLFCLLLVVFLTLLIQWWIPFTILMTLLVLTGLILDLLILSSHLLGMCVILIQLLCSCLNFYICNWVLLWIECGLRLDTYGIEVFIRRNWLRNGESTFILILTLRILCCLLLFLDFMACLGHLQKLFRKKSLLIFCLQLLWCHHVARNNGLIRRTQRRELS